MKKFRFVFLILGFAALLYGCEKPGEDSYPGSPPSYLAGEVQAGLTDTTTFKTLYNLISSWGLSVNSANDFNCIALSSSDSLNYYKTNLNTGTIVNYGLPKMIKNIYPKISTRDSVMQLDLGFYNFGQTQANNWFNNTEKQLKIYEIAALVYGKSKSVYINVPVGKEDYWISQLKTNPIFVNPQRQVQ